MLEVSCAALSSVACLSRYRRYLFKYIIIGDTGARSLPFFCLSLVRMLLTRGATLDARGRCISGSLVAQPCCCVHAGTSAAARRRTCRPCRGRGPELSAAVRRTCRRWQVVSAVAVYRQAFPARARPDYRCRVRRAYGYHRQQAY